MQKAWCALGFCRNPELEDPNSEPFQILNFLNPMAKIAGVPVAARAVFRSFLFSSGMKP